MSDHGVEALLRPPVEKGVAYAAFMLAAIIYLYPTLFMLTEIVSHGTAVLFIGFGLYRYLQGKVISDYHKNLKRLPDYTIDSSKVVNVVVSSSKIVGSPTHATFAWKSGFGTSNTFTLIVS